MSTKLTVLTIPVPGTVEHPRENRFKVYWACGYQVQGLVEVEMLCQAEDLGLAAELSAMQHLMDYREVLGKDRAGNGVDLTCSYGAVKKLALGKSDKKSLHPFALFLRTRFADANITTSKDDSFIRHTRAHNHVEQLRVEQPLLASIQLVDGLRVGITAHALEQYAHRYQVFEKSDTWRALKAAMLNPSTKRMDGTGDEKNEFGHSVQVYVNDKGLRMIVVVDPMGARLVSCYYNAKLDKSHLKQHTSPMPVRKFWGQNVGFRT